MGKMTMSFSKGNKNETSIKHNNRSIESDFDFNKAGHKHIEREYTKLNEVLVHDDIRQVYEEEFGEAVKKYNAKQRRKDRKIDDYYSKVKHAKNMRTQYEFLVQVGNKENYSDKDRITSRQWQDSKKILEKYFDGFQKRNPNLRVYNAAIHMDEQGAPHMHMNVVPVAHLTNVKRGLDVKPSLNKALENEGFPISKEDNRKQFRDFQHREADALAQIALEYGIEREQGRVNKLKDVHEYKQVMREIDEREGKLRTINKQTRARLKQSDELDLQIADKRDKLAQLDTYNANRIDGWDRYRQAVNKVTNGAGTLKPARSYLAYEQAPFGRKKIDEQRTLENISDLLVIAKKGKVVESVMQDNKRLNVEYAEREQKAVAQAVEPLKKENQKLKQENAVLRAWFNTMLDTVRDKVANTKEFFRKLGSKMRINGITAVPPQTTQEEREQITQGYNSFKPVLNPRAAEIARRRRERGLER